MEIQIVIRCPGRFSEVLPEEPESAELAIEDCVSQVLLQLFETVIVDKVNVSYTPTEYRRTSYPGAGHPRRTPLV